ncbi:hypothetical protein VMCG_09943 [Cytospora schulzeri]|uniref:Fungal STAND N-terminal Goodbye domain-containing protein n=1 Tax=Cytospora schulzeri TaxID=448051 RepID=A0A423VF16_9PEZI|nr:hypothetical protein VMCG_09943 [Valsa malicola]
MADNRQLEAGFIKSEMVNIDAAFGVQSRYNDQLGLFQPKEPVYQLEKALSQYKDLDCSPKLTFSPETCSWDDVSCLLSEVQSQYDAKGKGFAGSVRKLLRKAGDHADSITPAFQMIPDSYGLSILRSSLGWMFLLLKQAAKYRKKILDAFEEIPRIILGAESRKKDFPQLNRLVEDLYDVLFKAMTKLIAYLLPKNQAAKIFPIFTNALSGSDIDLEIESVQKTVSILKERANILSEGLLVDIHKNGERRGRELQTELHATRHNTVSTLLSTQALGHQVSQVQDTIQPIPDKIEDLQKSMDELAEIFVTGERATINAMTSMANRAGIEAQNYMARHFTAMRQELEANIEDKFQRRERNLLQFMETEIERSRTPQSTGASQNGSLSAQTLLLILDAPFEAATRDLDSVVREGLHFGPGQQGQAQWLLEHNRFWQWFSGGCSDLLLVHGNLTGPSNDSVRISSLSVVSATIASAISQQENGDAIALYYFCGLRMSSIDDLSGPQGLIRCLTSRLVVGLKARYGIVANMNVPDGTYVEALRRRDVRYLCEAFRSVLVQFPPSATVYCILDGIAWYERPEILQDLFNIVQTLYGLVEGAYQGPVLKILLTSPFPSRSIASGMPATRQIFLNPEAMMLECEQSERMLFSHLGTRTYEVPELAVSRGDRRNPNHEDEQWTEDDYN